MVLSIMSETEKYQIMYFFGNIFIIGFCTDIFMIVKESLIYGESAYFLTRQSVPDRCVPGSLFLDFFVKWMICTVYVPWTKSPTAVPISMYYIYCSFTKTVVAVRLHRSGINVHETYHPKDVSSRGRKIQEETIRDTSVRDGLSWHPGRRAHS